MQKAQKALTEFWEMQALQGEAGHRTCVPADGRQRLVQHFLMRVVENARTELQGLPTKHLLPPGDSRGQLLDTHGFPNLILGHERETLAQTVIIHCGERRVMPVEDDSLKEKDRPHMLGENEEMALRGHNTFNRCFSLSLFLTQKAMSTTHSWNAEA